MKVIMRPGPGAIVRVRTKDGAVLENKDIVDITIEPYFSVANGQAEVIHGETTSAARGNVDQFAIAVSGASGKIMRRDRVEASVMPLIDRPAKTKPKPPTAVGAHKL